MKKTICITLLSALFVVTGVDAFAQNDSVAKAVLIVTDPNLSKDVAVKKALETIDRAIRNPQSEKNAYAWYVRGFVYKEYYKTFESGNKRSKTRSDAVAFFGKALTLDSTKEYDADIRKNLKFIGSTYYNDAATLLDGDSYQQAIESYDKFKECMLMAEPGFNLRPWEINFKTVLADQYAKDFRSDLKQNLDAFHKAEVTYKEVVALDTNNWSGNFNLAMLYYNYGVDIINNMSVESDIMMIDNIQEEAKELFKKALPYALKAYSMRPKERRILVALQGIYFSLYEFEKSDEFKAKAEGLEKEK